MTERPIPEASELARRWLTTRLADDILSYVDARVAQARAEERERAASKVNEWGFSIAGTGEITHREAEAMVRDTLDSLATTIRADGEG